MIESDGWVRVLFADDCASCECCGDTFCVRCDMHYADCDCPGPMQDDEFEYREQDGVLLARRRVTQ